jgi:hypothetical protein
MGFDNRAHLLHCRLKIDAFGNPEAHLAGMWRRRINAEVTQGLAPDAAIRHDYLHLVVAHQLGPEQR